MNNKHTGEEEFESMLIQALNEYAEEQGRKLGEEIYPQPHYSKAYQKNINRLLRQSGAVKMGRMGSMSWSKIAACVMVLILTSGGLTYNASARFRLFVNHIFSVKDDHIKVSNNTFNQEYDFSVIPDDWEYFSIPEYLPAGYEVTSLKADNEFIEIIYTNMDSRFIFRQCFTSEFYHNLDFEHSSAEKIKINSFDGYYVLDEYSYTLMWADKEHSYFLTEVETDLDELIKIAESLKKLHN